MARALQTQLARRCYLDLNMNSTPSSKAIILDGGMATELERRGHDLNHALWSARLLISDPDEIVAVHREYLAAGADCISTASYQATISGFEELGVGSVKAEELIRTAVRLAHQARSEFWSIEPNRNSRSLPIVAASVGPYGAFLANGSEYTGDYDLSVNQLYSFHEHRWRLLAEESPDVMLCETVPSFLEVQALTKLAEQHHNRPTWVSLSCRDGQHICDGTPMGEVAKYLDNMDAVSVIGVNCTAPQFIDSLIGEIRGVSSKPIAVYPNSGEKYDVGRRTWSGERDTVAFADRAVRWHALGATYVGGCCRTTPEHIRQIRKVLVG